MNNLSLPLKMVIGAAICLAIGSASGIATASSVNTWFVTLNKPSFNPPSWLFAPVWTVLYALMGVAAALVWHEGWEKSTVKNALLFFGIQLLLNSLWSILFFGIKRPDLAFIEIIILWVVLLITILKFTKIKKVAGYLLIPYILWVSFATVLNGAIWQLN